MLYYKQTFCSNEREVMVGDFVICINACGWGHVLKGKIYQVRYITPVGVGFIEVETNYMYDINKFKFVKPGVLPPQPIKIWRGLTRKDL